MIQPTDTILRQYTDEALRARDGWGADLADLLLTLPAEYRQPCIAEANLRLATYDAVNPIPGGHAYIPIGPYEEMRRKVAAEILAQLAKDGTTDA